MFNVGDLTGRLLSSKVPVTQIRNMSTKLVVGSLVRGIFFLLFMLCVTSNDVGSGSDDHQVHNQGDGRDSNGNGRFKIHSDMYSFIVQFLFACTNGLLISCSFMYASSRVEHTTDMQERSSEMLTFAIGFGLLSGSLLSFPFANIASKW